MQEETIMKSISWMSLAVAAMLPALAIAEKPSLAMDGIRIPMEKRVLSSELSIARENGKPSSAKARPNAVPKRNGERAKERQASKSKSIPVPPRLVRASSFQCG